MLRISKGGYLETTTTTMATFISDIVTPVTEFVIEQVRVVGGLVIEMPILGMVFGVFLLGAGVGIISRIIRSV